MEKEVFMKKDELIDLISSTMDMTKAQARKELELVDAIIEDVIIPNLERNEKVKLGSYIVLSREDRDEKQYRNPKTGESVITPAHIEYKVKRTNLLRQL